MFLREWERDGVKGSKYLIWWGSIARVSITQQPEQQSARPLLFSVFFFFLFLLLIKRREERKGEIIHTHTRHTLAVVVCSRSLECPLCFFLLLFIQITTTPLSFRSLSKNCLPVLLYLRWDSYNRSSAFIFFFLSIHDGKKATKKAKKEMCRCRLISFVNCVRRYRGKKPFETKLAPFVSYLQRVITW